MKLDTPWFGPKTGFGWGWTPVTWQGWTITTLFVAFILVISYGPSFRHKAVLFGTALAGYVSIVVATGTKPGGSF